MERHRYINEVLMYNWWYEDGKEIGARFGKTEVERENNFPQRHTTSLEVELGCIHKSNADLITLLSASKCLFYAENQAKCFNTKVEIWRI